jgi:solute carrier family 25, member 33/36
MAYTMAPKDLTPDRAGQHRRARDDLPLVESRETGDVIPETRQAGPLVANKENPFAKSWAHFVAGG